MAGGQEPELRSTSTGGSNHLVEAMRVYVQQSVHEGDLPTAGEYVGRLATFTGKITAILEGNGTTQYVHVRPYPKGPIRVIQQGIVAESARVATTIDANGTPQDIHRLTGRFTITHILPLL